MQRLGLAVTTAVVLSMIPAAPQALAAPYVPNGAIVATVDSSIVEVGNRGKKYRKKYSKRHKKYRRGCRNCRSRYYARGYRYGYPYVYGYRHRGVHGCVSFDGVTICF